MAKWLYRLESQDPEKGLWYNLKNEMVWNIGDIPDCTTKDLPMGYDERYHKDGKNWFSSCSNIEDLSHWYSLDNAKELIKRGFVFTKYLAVDYVEYEKETTFLKETALERVVLDIEDIWGIPRRQELLNKEPEERTYEEQIELFKLLFHLNTTNYVKVEIVEKEKLPTTYQQEVYRDGGTREYIKGKEHIFFPTKLEFPLLQNIMIKCIKK